MTLHHVVMFRLQDPVDAAEAVDRLRAMSGRIPSLLSLRAGRATNSGEGAGDLVLITEHADAAGLADYAAHPVHQELLGWIRPRIADRTVVDTVDLG